MSKSEAANGAFLFSFFQRDQMVKFPKGGLFYFNACMNQNTKKSYNVGLFDPFSHNFLSKGLDQKIPLEF